MKIVDKLVAVLGSDKLLHYGIGGMMNAIITMFITNLTKMHGFWQLLWWFIAWVIVVAISYIKEKYFDTEVDHKDVRFATYGSLLVLIGLLLSLLMSLCY